MFSVSGLVWLFSLLVLLFVVAQLIQTYWVPILLFLLVAGGVLGILRIILRRSSAAVRSAVLFSVALLSLGGAALLLREMVTDIDLFRANRGEHVNLGAFVGSLVLFPLLVVLGLYAVARAVGEGRRARQKWQDELERDRQDTMRHLAGLSESGDEEILAGVDWARAQLGLAVSRKELDEIRISAVGRLRQSLMRQLGDLEKYCGEGTVDYAREISRRPGSGSTDAFATAIGAVSSLAAEVALVRELETKLVDLEKSGSRVTLDFAHKARRELVGGVMLQRAQSVFREVDLWSENQRTFEILDRLVNSGDRKMIYHGTRLWQKLYRAGELAGKKRHAEFQRIAIETNARWASMRGTSSGDRNVNEHGDTNESGFGHEQDSGSGRADSTEAAYKVLGISPHADDEAVREAYRKTMQEHHPDRVVGMEEKIRAEKRAKEINAAYAKIRRIRNL